MHFIIRFETDLFDVSKERKNPINPIYGESLLLWLKDRLKGRFEITDPDAEDWGWYSTMEWKGRRYMLGSSAAEEDKSHFEWTLQVDKQRSIIERLFGKEKMNINDECFVFIKKQIEGEKSFVVL